MENEVVFTSPTQQKGFSPVRTANGRIVDPSDQFQVKAAYGVALYTGQVVHQYTDGYVRALGADNDLVLGVFNGVWFVNATGDTIFRPYWPASQTLQTGSVAKASIYDPVGTFFQLDSNAAVVFADLDKFADLTGTYGKGGSVLTGRSSAQLDHANIDASLTANNVVRIRELSQQPGATKLVIVQIARPQFGALIGA